MLFTIQTISSLDKGRSPIFDKLDFPSTKDVSCRIRLKLAQLFLRKTFLNFINVFLLFRNYLPLEKDGTLHFGANLDSLHHRMLCAKFGWNWPSGPGEEDGNVKSVQTDRQMDKRTTDNMWSGELKHCNFVQTFNEEFHKLWTT